MIRFLRRLGLGLAVLLLFVGGAVALLGPVRFPGLMGLIGEGGAPIPAIGGPFALTQANTGRPFTEANLRGGWTLIYFGYTFCPDVCPTDLAKAVQSLSLMDPARDTAPVLARYVALFSPRLIGLTGSAPEVAAAESDYHVYAEKQPVPNGGGTYFMNHSAFFYLVNPDGRAVAILPPNLDAKAMAASLQRSLSASPVS
jgi:protein SCO1/2